ncbi:hypothetical protein QL285_040947 [Trifolium repens]|nr:hypothetical protein QL285_040947 [Trifolium repens]
MRFDVEVKPDYNYMSWFRAIFSPFISSNRQLQDPRVVELMPTRYPSPPPPPPTQQQTEVFHTPLHFSQPQYHMDTSNPYTYHQTSQQHYASSSSFQPSPSTFQPPPSTYQPFGFPTPQEYNNQSSYQPFRFPPPPSPQQQQQHFGFPPSFQPSPSQVEFGNVDNEFFQRLVDDSDFSPNWFNSMAQVMDSSFPIQTQSSGQNLGFDLNTPVEEEEEEEEQQQQQQHRTLY